MSTRVPAGSVIARVYFVVLPYPGAHSPIGSKQDSFNDALDAAADHYAGRQRAFAAMDLPEMPPLPVIVERWLIQYPPDAPSGTMDMAIEHTAMTRDAIRRSLARRGLR